MSRNMTALTILAVVASAVAAVHILALQYFWYWLFPLLDVPMHFSGGFFIGGSALFLVAGLANLRIKDPLRVAFFAALLVGIGWEVFEKMTGIETGAPLWYYIYDTIKDLILDMLGGLLAGYLFSKLLGLEIRRSAPKGNI